MLEQHYRGSDFSCPTVVSPIEASEYGRTGSSLSITPPIFPLLPPLQRPTRVSIGTGTIFRGRPVRDSSSSWLLRHDAKEQTRFDVNLALSRVAISQTEHLQRVVEWSTGCR
jgi:hypothetical protein